MSKITELALELKARNNVKTIGNIVGTVLSINPLKIGILNNEVILDNCILANTFKTLLDGGLIINGDNVLIISQDQVFFLMDKVVL